MILLPVPMRYSRHTGIGIFPTERLGHLAWMRYFPRLTTSEKYGLWDPISLGHEALNVGNRDADAHIPPNVLESPLRRSIAKSSDVRERRGRTV